MRIYMCTSGAAFSHTHTPLSAVLRACERLNKARLLSEWKQMWRVTGHRQATNGRSRTDEHRPNVYTDSAGPGRRKSTRTDYSSASHSVHNSVVDLRSGRTWNDRRQIGTNHCRLACLYRVLALTLHLRSNYPEKSSDWWGWSLVGDSLVRRPYLLQQIIITALARGSCSHVRRSDDHNMWPFWFVTVFGFQNQR